MQACGLPILIDYDFLEIRVCTKINSEIGRRDFGRPRGAKEEHIRGIRDDWATKRTTKRTSQIPEVIFAQTLRGYTLNTTNILQGLRVEPDAPSRFAGFRGGEPWSRARYTHWQTLIRRQNQIGAERRPSPEPDGIKRNQAESGLIGPNQGESNQIRPISSASCHPLSK
jgi:hypothetical protein